MKATSKRRNISNKPSSTMVIRLHWRLVPKVRPTLRNW